MVCLNTLSNDSEVLAHFLLIVIQDNVKLNAQVDQIKHLRMRLKLHPDDESVVFSLLKIFILCLLLAQQISPQSFVLIISNNIVVIRWERRRGDWHRHVVVSVTPIFTVFLPNNFNIN